MTGFPQSHGSEIPVLFQVLFQYKTKHFPVSFVSSHNYYMLVKVAHSQNIQW